MCRDRIAGKRCLVQKQDLVALLGQQHGSRRPRTPSANNNCVVHLYLPTKFYERVFTIRLTSSTITGMALSGNGETELTFISHSVYLPPLFGCIELMKKSASQI